MLSTKFLYHDGAIYISADHAPIWPQNATTGSNNSQVSVSGAVINRRGSWYPSSDGNLKSVNTVLRFSSIRLLPFTDWAMGMMHFTTLFACCVQDKKPLFRNRAAPKPTLPLAIGDDIA